MVMYSLTTNNKDANETVSKIENNQQTDSTAKEDNGNEERQSTRTTHTTQENNAVIHSFAFSRCASALFS